MNQTLFAVDANGNPIAVLAPREATTHTLTSGAAEALAADSAKTRVVRLYTTATDCKIGVGETTSAIMSLAANAPEAIKVDAGLTLYASGTGSLEIVVMG